MADILNLISTSSQNNEERYKFIQDLLVNKSDIPFDKEEVRFFDSNRVFPPLIFVQILYSSSFTFSILLGDCNSEYFAVFD